MRKEIEAEIKTEVKAEVKAKVRPEGGSKKSILHNLPSNK